MRRPIFILGITGRSGTNFLWDLLGLHPDCGLPRSVTTEDYLVHHAGLLFEYTEAVQQEWKPGETVDATSRAALRECLGESLLWFLSQDLGSKRLVTKTPSVHNLEYFFDFFPQAHLLILVRDGRAVVESHVRSFGRSYEGAMQQWVEGARTILAFDEAAKSADWKYMIVRYEDLWHNSRNELQKIFAFTGLDAARYDFEAAQNLPVRGSSELREQTGDMHWQPMAKTAAFDPTQRWRGWSPSRHARFNWLAGAYMRQLGYHPQADTVPQLLARLQNCGLDGLSWVAKRLPVGFLHAAMRVLRLSRKA